jgi:hypothetical protein
MIPMAQYLISVLTETGENATEQEMAAIDVFNDQLIADGHWVYANGLSLPADATVVDGRHGEAVFTDGPFAETKEFVVGFWIVEAADLEVARRLAAEGSKSCNRRVELRAVLGQ